MLKCKTVGDRKERTMAQFSATFAGPDVFLISVDERVKHDQQFHSLSPSSGGYITGDQARNFFLQSGLPPPVLAQIWALADMNSDGKMDIYEFSIAMKLIKLMLQGHPLPSTLPPSMKQLSLSHQAGFGLPPFPPIAAPLSVTSLPVVPPLPPLPVGVSPPLPPPSIANGAPPSGMIPPIPGFSHPAAPVNKSSSFNRSSVKLQKNPSFDAVSGGSPAPSQVDWAVPQSCRLKYRQLFNSHDKMMSGHLTGPQARTILMQSSLPQGQLASIWGLSDIDQDGKLTAEEFILAMHLIDMAMSGLPLPAVLPADYIPPTFRRVRSDSVQSDTKNVQEELEEEADYSQDKKLPVTFEDKKRENFERGNLELEKRRQALQELQRKEQERLATIEREELERKERERLEQERRRQQELEKQLEKQRELERQREEERRREIEKREAAKRELERQRQLEWERQRRQELLNQRNREQESIVLLKARKKTLEFELEALNDKKCQLEGKLTDVRFRLSKQQQEVEQNNQTKEARIAEIRLLQQQLQDSQQWLGRLIPDKQSLNDQLKQVEQNSLHCDNLSSLQKAVEQKESNRKQLKDQLDSVEKETRAKLLEIDAFNTQLKELREIHSRQQRQKLKEIETDAHTQGFSQAPRKSVELPEPRLPSREGQSWREDVLNSVSGSAPHAWLQRVTQEEKEHKRRIMKEEEEGCNTSGLMEDQQSRGKKEILEKPNKVFGPPTEQWPTTEKAPPSSSSASSTLFDHPHATGSELVKVVYYRALYPFDARSHDEITITPGDIIMVDESQTGEPGWLGGELRGQTGWFPANYAERIPESEAPTGMHAFSSTAPSAAQPNSTPPPAPGNTPAASANSNWADFSSTWPSNPSSQSDSEGWDAWPTSTNQNPSLSVPSAQLRQRSAFTPATMTTGSSPSPVLGQGEKVEGLQAQALYPWRAKKENHLNFNKNEIITVLEQQDMWWLGELQSGQRGWFPKSYVKLLTAVVRPPTMTTPTLTAPAVTTPNLASSRNKNNSESAPLEGSPNGKKTSPSPAKPSDSIEEFVAMYTYESSEQGDLSFQQGDVVTVNRKEGDWWTGTVAGKTGVFPSNYVKPRDSTQEGFGAGGKTGSLGKKPEIAQVIAPYSATGAEQLTLAPGQLILIRKKNPGGWWEGELQARGKKRQIGWFPANYVKLLSPSTTKTTPTEPTPPKLATPNTVMCQVIGMYDYVAQNDDELAFQKGQVITVLNKDDCDWWKGELNGREGLFPSNYVKLTTDMDPSTQ